MWKSASKFVSLRSFARQGVFRVQPFSSFRAFGFLNRSFASFSQAEVVSAVVSQVQSIDGVESAKVNASSIFADIGLDSLAQIEMYSHLEGKFGITLSDEDTDGVKGVPDLVNIIVSKLN